MSGFAYGIALVPDGMFAGDFFAPFAGPAFHKMGGVTQLGISLTQFSIALAPCKRHETGDDEQRAQHDGLDAMAVLMHADFLRIGDILAGGEDEQAEAETAAGIPLRIDTAAVGFMRVFFAHQQERDQSDQRGQRAPCAVEEDEKRFFHSVIY